LEYKEAFYELVIDIFARKEQSTMADLRGAVFRIMAEIDVDEDLIKFATSLPEKFEGLEGIRGTVIHLLQEKALEALDQANQAKQA